MITLDDAKQAARVWGASWNQDDRAEALQTVRDYLKQHPQESAWVFAEIAAVGYRAWLKEREGNEG